MVYNNLNEFLESRQSGSHLTKKIKTEIDQRIKQLGLDSYNLQLGAKLYILRNNLSSIPLCKKCNKQLTYFAPSCSYRTYCSAKCSLNSKQTLDKRRTTNLKKYGIINAANNNRKQRLDNYFIESYNDFTRFNSKVIPQFSEKEFKGATARNAYTWCCVRCNNIFERVFIPSSQKWPKCPHCDSEFTDIEKFISNFLKENNITFKPHYRKIIKKHEVDFFLPDQQIAIETHGLFYHTECFFEKQYHKNKTNLCLEKGIKLIQIFSDEIEQKPKICKNRLKAILGLNRKIQGRKCTVQQISAADCKKFLEKYHSQGPDKSSVRYSLSYKNRVLAVMTFCKLRNILGQTHSQGCWELSRFACISNITILGGFQKMLSFFIKENQQKEIISYCDKRWSPSPTDNIYAKSGFTLMHTTEPNYWYTKNFQQRLHRANFQKHKLLASDSTIDSSKTEKQIMKELGYQRIWDAGHYKFVMKV